MPSDFRFLKALPAVIYAWMRDRLRPRAWAFLTECWARVIAHRYRSSLGTLALAALLLAGIKLAPPIYGRFALAHASEIAARQSRIKGEERVVRELRLRAFELGFTQAALAPEVFRLEEVLTDEGPCCRVSYDFIHRVPFYGLLDLPLRMKHEVLRLQIDPQPNPLEPDKP